ncbi:hypothetical protein [Methylosarcina fibrata]|uniref:hypothetical protein n=1 Tax=Methylosarcina fibrata TaxID=105972 RepID=UPI00036641B9|nr:hypothetical protein [Methylosarcina fibrata]
MSIKTRVNKLEAKHRPIGLVVIILMDGETEEQALQRCYPDEKPDQVVFLDEADKTA